jgi:hypothetical protein
MRLVGVLRYPEGILQKRAHLMQSNDVFALSDLVELSAESEASLWVPSVSRYCTTVVP